MAHPLLLLCRSFRTGGGGGGGGSGFTVTAESVSTPLFCPDGEANGKTLYSNGDGWAIRFFEVMGVGYWEILQNFGGPSETSVWIIQSSDDTPPLTGWEESWGYPGGIGFPTLAPASCS